MIRDTQFLKSFFLALFIVSATMGYSHTLIPDSITSSFRTIDEYASEDHFFQLSSTQEIAEELTSRYYNSIQKARAIYIFLAKNISYDNDYFSRPTGYQPNWVVDAKKDTIMKHNILKRKKGICMEFAEVFSAMCNYIGVEAGTITGWAKGAGYHWLKLSESSNHAWNYFVSGKDTFLLDVTWAACTGKYNYYFCTPPYSFIYSHYPKQGAFQLLDTKINKEDFGCLDRNVEVVAEPTSYLKDKDDPKMRATLRRFLQVKPGFYYKKEMLAIP